ncbi:MAG: GntR family transcriptional regulator [Anaerolineae bacterium]
MFTTRLFQDQTSTSADNVANQLREEILRGTLKVDQVLRQDKIASRLGTSTIPVREALFKLNAEGLVEFIPNRGAFVLRLSGSELQEIYTLRLSLETLALKNAIGRYTDQILGAAERILYQMDSEKDIINWGELNWQFHRTLLEPADMPRLIGILRSLHLNIIRFLLQNVSTPEEFELRAKHRAEHFALLKACRDRDAEISEILLERHLSQTTSLLLRFLEQ